MKPFPSNAPFSRGYYPFFLLFLALLATSANAFSQLSGTYTIGGNMPDYATFNEAVDALTIEGVAGPVVFNVRDGYYNEQVTIPAIANTSDVNTITFQSENSNAEEVELAFQATQEQFFTLFLSGCSHVNFSHLSFAALDPLFARVLVTSGASNILIEHCIFNGSTQACADIDVSVLIHTNFGGGSDNWIIRSNVFNDACTHLIVFEGDNWLIEDNDFNDALTYGLFAGGGEGMVINGNRSNIYTGMYFTQQYGLVVINNDWKGRLTFDGPSGTNEDHTIIANNFFYGSLALELIYAEFLDIVNNSFYATGSCIYTQYGGNMNVVNNIFYATGGVVLNGFNNADFGNCHNNNLFSESNDLIEWNGVTYTSIAEWQANTTYGDNSVNIEPLFFSGTDLHICNAALDGLAVPVEGLPTDIDGQTRDLLNPDMGADEFDPETCGCTLSATASITSNYNGQALSCYGQQDGSAICEVSGAVGEVSYLWSNSGNLAEGIYLGEGEHTCTVSDDNCTVEVTIYVPAPQPVNAIILEEIDPTCPTGSNGQITALGNGGTMDFTYAWSPEGGDEATATGLEGGVEYTVSIMDSNGCLATQMITLNSPEIPEIYASNDVEICLGDTVEIWASGGEAYEWSNDLGGGWTVEVSPEVTTNYIVTGYNFAGCEAQDEVTVTVNESPDVTIADFDPSAVCIDAVPVAIPTTTPSGGVVSGPGIEGDFFDPELAGIGVHFIEYVYNDGSGCNGTATTQIEVHDLPAVVLDPFDPATVCLNEEPFSVPAGSPVGGNYNGLGVTGTTFDPNAAGIGTHDISYIYTDEFNCYSWDIQQIVVLEAISVTIEPFNVDTLCLNDAAIPLPTGFPAGGSYAGPGVVGNGFDPSEAGVGNHTIVYAYTDAIGCSNEDETTISVFDCTSVSEFDQEQALLIFPNPAQDNFTIQLPASEKELNQLVVFDALGSVVAKETFSGPSHLAEGLHLESGVYLVQVQSKSGQFRTRLIIR